MVKALDYRALGRGSGTGLQSTGSWLRHWTTEHWVVVKALDYRALGHG